MAFPTGWTKRVAVVIDKTYVGSGGVSDFSVLLLRANFGSNGDAMFYGAASAQANGGDVRFTSDEAGTTQLPCDVIAFGLDSADSAEDSVCMIRVKAASVSSAANTTIYCWYVGNPAGSETQPAANTTYGQYNAYDANWKGYWPLRADLNDRTSNAQNLTNQGTVVPGDSAGKFGLATSFNGTNQYANRTGQITAATPVTIMAWVKVADTRWNCVLTNTGDYGNDSHTLLCRNGLATYAKHTIDNTGADGTTTAPSIGTWGHVAGILNSASSRTAYLNASAGSENTTSLAGTFNTTNGTVAICYNGYYFKGVIQDIQFHTANRGAAWITTEYNQTNAPAAFAAGGTPTTVGTGNRRRRVLCAA